MCVYTHTAVRNSVRVCAHVCVPTDKRKWNTTSLHTFASANSFRCIRCRCAAVERRRIMRLSVVHVCVRYMQIAVFLGSSIRRRRRRRRETLHVFYLGVVMLVPFEDCAPVQNQVDLSRRRTGIARYCVGCWILLSSLVFVVVVFPVSGKFSGVCNRWREHQTRLTP